MPKYSNIGGLNSEELKKVQSILGDCENLQRAQIFGSRAINTHKTTSDVDLALFGEHLSRLDVNTLKIAFEDSLLPYTFDLVLHHTIKEPELLTHIQQRGIDIYRQGFYLSKDGEWIPEGWTNSPLNRVVSDFIDYRGKTPKKTNSGIPLVTAKVVKEGRVLQTEEFIDESEYEAWMRRGIPKNGDVILTTEAPFGEVAFIPKGKIALAQRIITLRGKTGKLNNGFLKYSLQSPLMQYRLTARESGSTVLGIKSSELKVTDLLHPEDLNEQVAIAAVLGSLDDKIELLREQNETLEALAQTLFKRWFIDFNFPDKNGNPYKNSSGKMIASELGEIPEGWKVGNFEDDGFCLTMGQSPSSSSYNEDDSGTLFFQGRAEFGWRFPTPRLFTTEPSRMANEGNILLSVRAPVGDINLAMQSCCVGRGLCAMSHQFSSYGLYKVKSLTHFFDQYNQEGTVFGSISKKDFQRPELLIPNDDLVSLFEQLAAPLDVKIKSNTQQTETLTQLRDTLLPKLMKGEIRVTS